MTLQAWGAIGELVGGVAVIATLVFLAIQIREYRLGMSSATFHSTMQGSNQLNAMLGADPSLAEVLERGGRMFRARNTTCKDLYAHLDAMPDLEAPAYGWALATADDQPGGEDHWPGFSPAA